MNYTVPQLSIVFMAVAALIGIAIPVVLFIIFRRKLKSDIAPFFIGCAVFAVFALVLEGAAHMLILKTDVGVTIQSNILLMALYGGLMAGIFEETGRFVAFRTVLRKKLGNDRNALMYGAGHGGFEAFYILFFSMISYIVMSVMLNAGLSGTLTANITDEGALRALDTTFALLSGTAPGAFLMGVIERIAAVALHISLSVLVWFAAKEKGCFRLYPLAVLLHTLVNAVAVILARAAVNVWLIEGAIYIMTAGCILIARRVWKTHAAKAVTALENAAGTVPVPEAAEQEKIDEET